MKTPRLLLKTDITTMMETALRTSAILVGFRPGYPASPRNALLVSLLYHHALRVKDILTLGWDDLDRTRNLHTSALPDPSRPIGLYRHEVELFYWHRRLTEADQPHAPQLIKAARLVFPIGRARLHQVVNFLGRRARLGHVTACDLRYSRARHALDDGATLDSIQAMLGLTTRKAAEKYLIVPTDLQQGD